MGEQILPRKAEFPSPAWGRAAPPPFPEPSAILGRGHPTATAPSGPGGDDAPASAPRVPNSGGSCLGRRERISPDLRRCPLTRHESLKAGLPRGHGTRVPFVRALGLRQSLHWTRPCGDRLGFMCRGDGLGLLGYSLGLFSPCNRPRLQREGIPPPPLPPLPRV